MVVDASDTLVGQMHFLFGIQKLSWTLLYCNTAELRVVLELLISHHVEWFSRVEDLLCSG
jgi:hypothetical protein